MAVQSKFMFLFLLFSFFSCVHSMPVNAEEELDPWLIHPVQEVDGIEFYSASVSDARGNQLFVACASANDGIRVNFVPATPFVYQAEIVAVTYRIDEKPSVAVDFHRTADKAGAFVLFDPALSIVNDIYGGKSRLIYEDVRGSVEFTLNGANYAIEHLQQNCPFVGLGKLS